MGRWEQRKPISLNSEHLTVGAHETHREAISYVSWHRMHHSMSLALPQLLHLNSKEYYWHDPSHHAWIARGQVVASGRLRKSAPLRASGQVASGPTGDNGGVTMASLSLNASAKLASFFFC